MIRWTPVFKIAPLQNWQIHHLWEFIKQKAAMVSGKRPFHCFNKNISFYNKARFRISRIKNFYSLSDILLTILKATNWGLKSLYTSSIRGQKTQQFQKWTSRRGKWLKYKSFYKKPILKVLITTGNSNISLKKHWKLNKMTSPFNRFPNNWTL